jgi:hypothetical protein
VQSPYGNWVNALDRYKWDVVTLEPFDQAITGRTGDAANISNFINRIKARNTNAQVYLYETWPTFEGTTLNYHDWWRSAYDGMNDRTVRSRDYFNHLVAAVNSAGPMRKRVGVLPVGEVLFELNERMHAGMIPGYTDISQFYADGIHLNLLGSYTAAVTWYATIFNDDPHGLTTAGYGTIDPTLAWEIQDTAWKTLKDPTWQSADPIYATLLGNVPEPNVVMLAIILFTVTRRRRST